MRTIDIIQKVRNLRKPYTIPSEKYQPIANFDSYIQAKVRAEGGVSKRLNEIKDMQMNAVVQQTNIPCTTYKYPHDFEHVSVNIKVTKKTGVKVTMCLPFLDQYNNYHSKGINVPLPEKIKLMKMAGYPDSVLENIINRDLWWSKNKKSNKEFIENIFGRK